MGSGRSQAMGGIFDFWKKKKEPEVPPQAVPQVPPGIDFYAVLRVPPTASDEEMRAAFRVLARRFHPDVHPDNPEMASEFSKITQAYDVLRDPVRRAKYDRSRGVDPARPSPAAVPPRPPSRELIVPGPTPPSLFSAFKFPGAAPPKEKPPGKKPAAAPRELTMWEQMFGVAYEEPTHPAIRPEEIFRPFTPPAPEPPFQFPGTPTPKTPRPFMPVGSQVPGSQIFPSVLEMAEFIRGYWPLDAIWEVVGDGRRSAEFQSTGIIDVDRLAGNDPQEGVEYELAEHLGLDNALINDYQRRGALRSTLWSEILYPMFDIVAQAFREIKPKEFPGVFFISPTEDLAAIDLFYHEPLGLQPGR